MIPTFIGNNYHSTHSTCALENNPKALYNMSLPANFPNTAQISQFCQFAKDIADQAGAHTRQYFRTTLDIMSKTDTSPVTIADRETEQLLRKQILAHYPKHQIIGEEFADMAGTSESGFRWTLDPIDGTQSFITGTPMYGVLIALDFAAKPVLGVIEMPALGERFVAHFSHEHNGFVGYWKLNNGEQVALSVSQTHALGEAKLFAAHPNMFVGDTGVKFSTLEQACRVSRFSTDCYAYGLLASGQIDIVAENLMNPYDYRALIPIVEAAGGIITNWEGVSLTDIDPHKNNGLSTVLAANPTLHKKALELLRSC